MGKSINILVHKITAQFKHSKQFYFSKVKINDDDLNDIILQTSECEMNSFLIYTCVVVFRCGKYIKLYTYILL